MRFGLLCFTVSSKEIQLFSEVLPKLGIIHVSLYVPDGNLETFSFSCIHIQPNGESGESSASMVRVYEIMFFC